MTIPPPKYLLLGEILRPHGVRGELRVRLLTDYPERINELERIFIGSGIDADDVRPYPVQHMRMHQGYGLLKLKTIDDRNAADLLRGLFVMIDLEHAVPLEEGEFYLYQLIGLTVQQEDGSLLGTLVEVLETAAHDVYVVDSPTYGEVLIPVTDETILVTDIDAGIVRVRLPEGLLPD
ncbi:MAG: ribosome maturation factor RimM [Chloroflexota bacterium]|nr:MAG: 16S rRNA processing protein RimM [Chloroflexota bacterium]